MEQETTQQRHEEIIDFLSKFKQYQSLDGTPSLPKISEVRTSDMFENISTNEINRAVIVFTDVLNLSGGSVGNVDLYKLLQAYLEIPEYRSRFNELVREAKSFQYKKATAEKNN